MNQFDIDLAEDMKDPKFRRKFKRVYWWTRLRSAVRRLFGA